MKETIMSANNETCANKDKSVCDYNEFRRLRYFHGMLLDEKDFREEQQYHASKRRLLNRMLHGSGVVCGLELKGKKGKRGIQITPGLALDCSGNEIWVSKDLKIDLASLLPPKNKPKSESDCRPVDEKDDLKTYYIGIRYDEKPTSPVSVYLPSGDCEERTCENSRWKEGYCVEIVECCSETETPGLLANLCDCDGNGSLDKEKYKDPCAKCGPDPNETKDKGAAAQQDPARGKEWCECMVLEEFCEKSVACPECCSCDQPCYVILGQIKIDPENCVLETVCMNECRRYVLTGRLVQQVLLRIVGGAEDRFQVKVGNDIIKLKDGEKFSDYIYNPIKAICYWLFYRSKKGDFNLLPCDKQQPEPTGGTFVRQKELDEKLSAQRREFTNLLAVQQKQNKELQNALFDRIEKMKPLAATDIPVTAEKEGSKQTKKEK
jgi:hypothetical protein